MGEKERDERTCSRQDAHKRHQRGHFFLPVPFSLLQFLPLSATRTLSYAFGVLRLGPTIYVGGRRQGHGRRADLAQAVLDKRDLSEGRSIGRLGGGAGVGRHGIFWEGGVTCGVCVCVWGEMEGKDENAFFKAERGGTKGGSARHNLFTV